MQESKLMKTFFTFQFLTKFRKNFTLTMLGSIGKYGLIRCIQVIRHFHAVKSVPILK